MNKKNIWLVVLVIIVCIFALIAGALLLQPKLDFSHAKDQVEYDFIDAYVNAADEMSYMSSTDAAAYMATHDLEADIQKMHEAIDEHISFLKKWEKESNTVYVEPYRDIYNMIALEHAYHLSKIGVDIESEKWSLLEDLIIIDIELDARHYSNSRNILRAELEKPTFLYGIAKDVSLTDYVGAYWNWKDLEEKATTYLNDIDVPDEKKKWVYEFMQKDPYGDLCQRLEEKGLAWDGTPL